MPKRTNTRNKIKDVALDLFSTQGFSGTSVRDISGTVGIRESGIYNHFSSKEDILRVLLEDVKNATVGVEIITDELLDKLSAPPLFMKEFVKIVINHWSSQKQKKYLRLVLIEQFREIEGIEISLKILIDESIKIWSIIFSQMIKFKYIKKNDAIVLAEEFVYPFFMIRLQYLTGDNVDLKIVFKKCNSHIDYFWSSIKR
ncbi:MAG: TetR/AcrR family transcriptional regulator [Bacteroidota bacterium]